MALWNQNDSRWDTVPDTSLTFDQYVTKLLRAPSTFGGPFATPQQTQQTPTTPALDQSKMQGMFEEYLKGKQGSSSSYQQPTSNLSDAEWAAVIDARNNSGMGWNNPFDVAMRQAALRGVMGMLGGPISFGMGVSKAQEAAEPGMQWLHNQMWNKAAASPEAVAAAVAAPYSGVGAENTSAQTIGGTNYFNANNEANTAAMNQVSTPITDSQGNTTYY